VPALPRLELLLLAAGLGLGGLLGQHVGQLADVEARLRVGLGRVLAPLARAIGGVETGGDGGQLLALGVVVGCGQGGGELEQLELPAHVGLGLDAVELGRLADRLGLVGHHLGPHLRSRGRVLVGDVGLLGPLGLRRLDPQLAQLGVHLGDEGLGLLGLGLVGVGERGALGGVLLQVDGDLLVVLAVLAVLAVGDLLGIGLGRLRVGRLAVGGAPAGERDEGQRQRGRERGDRTRRAVGRHVARTLAPRDRAWQLERSVGPPERAVGGLTAVERVSRNTA
jgi:hypothetical protein